MKRDEGCKRVGTRSHEFGGRAGAVGERVKKSRRPNSSGPVFSISSVVVSSARLVLLRSCDCIWADASVGVERVFGSEMTLRLRVHHFLAILADRYAPVTP